MIGWLSLVAAAATSVQGAPVEPEGVAAPLAQGLSTGGWLFMTVSLLFVWVLTLWCFRLVLKSPSPSDPGPAARP